MEPTAHETSRNDHGASALTCSHCGADLQLLYYNEIVENYATEVKLDADGGALFTDVDREFDNLEYISSDLVVSEYQCRECRRPVDVTQFDSGYIAVNGSQAYWRGRMADKLT